MTNREDGLTGLLGVRTPGPDEIRFEPVHRGSAAQIALSARAGSPT